MTEEMPETFEALTAKLAGTPEETARLTRDLSAQAVTIKRGILCTRKRLSLTRHRD